MQNVQKQDEHGKRAKDWIKENNKQTYELKRKEIDITTLPTHFLMFYYILRLLILFYLPLLSVTEGCPLIYFAFYYYFFFYHFSSNDKHTGRIGFPP